MRTLILFLGGASPAKPVYCYYCVPFWAVFYFGYPELSLVLPLLYELVCRLAAVLLAWKITIY